ncbi:MAG: RidA family protein [Symbiobacteriia bacterium]
MSNIEAKLTELGLTLPVAPAPAGAYVPVVRTGNLAFTSGQLPMAGGKLQSQGKVGQEVSLEEGYRLAQTCIVNALAALKQNLGGLDRIARVVKVVGFVASAPGFTAQPKVINGASDLLVSLFGEKGQHARSAVGVAELPLGSPVEVELIVEVEG